jgi:hypothetical protein
VQTLNKAEQSILNVTDDGDDDGFGALLTSPLDNQSSIAIALITPEYGDTPVPSASIPFTGNALGLYTLDRTPFVASYTVSAQVLPAETQNNVSNITLAIAAEQDEEDGADTEEGGTGTEGDATDTDE